jgi:hypothetical protein
VEARFQALLDAIDYNVTERVRSCNVHKIMNSLKLRKACEIDGILKECLRHLPRKPLVYLTYLFNTAFGCYIFQCLGME